MRKDNAMTILDKARENKEAAPKAERRDGQQQAIDSSTSQTLNSLENKFSEMMAEFNAIKGFSVPTGEQPVDTMIELLSSKGVAVSIAILLSYIRHCINKGLKKDITLKIGYNKPPEIPMNFALNEELLEDIYPGDVIEIN